MSHDCEVYSYDEFIAAYPKVYPRQNTLTNIENIEDGVNSTDKFIGYVYAPTVPVDTKTWLPIRPGSSPTEEKRTFSFVTDFHPNTPESPRSFVEEGECPNAPSRRVSTFSRKMRFPEDVLAFGSHFRGSSPCPTRSHRLIPLCPVFVDGVTRTKYAAIKIEFAELFRSDGTQECDLNECGCQNVKEYISNHVENITFVVHTPVPKNMFLEMIEEGDD